MPDRVTQCRGCERQVKCYPEKQYKDEQILILLYCPHCRTLNAVKRYPSDYGAGVPWGQDREVDRFRVYQEIALVEVPMRLWHRPRGPKDHPGPL